MPFIWIRNPQTFLRLMYNYYQFLLRVIAICYLFILDNFHFFFLVKKINKEAYYIFIFSKFLREFVKYLLK